MQPIWKPSQSNTCTHAYIVKLEDSRFPAMLCSNWHFVVSISIILQWQLYYRFFIRSWGGEALSGFWCAHESSLTLVWLITWWVYEQLLLLNRSPCFVALFLILSLLASVCRCTNLPVLLPFSRSQLRSRIMAWFPIIRFMILGAFPDHIGSKKTLTSWTHI